MGFLKKLFFGEEKKETKLEKEMKENIQNGADYSCATTENIIKCNGCGGDIEGVPRLQKFQGKMMYFHKRCWKAMRRGELPKPIPKNETENQTETQ